MHKYICPVLTLAFFIWLGCYSYDKKVIHPQSKADAFINAQLASYISPPRAQPIVLFASTVQCDPVDWLCLQQWAETPAPKKRGAK